MNTAKVVWREEKLGQLKVSAEELQPIRFQGQSFDEETGLHYNRFRYFDPDMGMFTSRDPIGLMGGDNVFAYAPNPTGWIDPLGLSSAKTHEKIYAQVLRSTMSKSQLPTTVAVVKHLPSGDVFKGMSSHSKEITHPILIRSLPSGESLEDWSKSNCAEIDALIQAFKKYPTAKMQDFEVHAINTLSGKTRKPCDNCKVTTSKCK